MFMGRVHRPLGIIIKNNVSGTLCKIKKGTKIYFTDSSYFVCETIQRVFQLFLSIACSIVVLGYLDTFFIYKITFSMK